MAEVRKRHWDAAEMALADAANRRALNPSQAIAQAIADAEERECKRALGLVLGVIERHQSETSLGERSAAEALSRLWMTVKKIMEGDDYADD